MSIRAVLDQLGHELEKLSNAKDTIDDLDNRLDDLERKVDEQDVDGINSRVEDLESKLDNYPSSDDLVTEDSVADQIAEGTRDLDNRIEKLEQFAENKGFDGGTDLTEQVDDLQRKVKEMEGLASTFGPDSNFGRLSDTKRKLILKAVDLISELLGGKE